MTTVIGLVDGLNIFFNLLGDWLISSIIIFLMMLLFSSFSRSSFSKENTIHNLLRLPQPTLQCNISFHKMSYSLCITRNCLQSAKNCAKHENGFQKKDMYSLLFFLGCRKKQCAHSKLDFSEKMAFHSQICFFLHIFF